MDSIKNLHIIQSGDDAAIADLKLHPDTITFGQMTPTVFAASQSLPGLLGYHLRWHNRTIRLVDYVITVQGGEEVGASRSYTQLGDHFYSRQSKKSARASARRMVMVALGDFQASGFQAFLVQSGGVAKSSRHKIGKGKNPLKDVAPEDIVLNTYLPGVFTEFFLRIQELACAIDLFALDLDERNRKLYYAVQVVARDMKARPIDQAPDDGEDEQVLAWKHKTQAELERGLREWEGAGVRLGLNAERLGLKLPTIDRKLDLHATQARLRVKHEIQRGQGQELPPDAAVRSRGRIGLETAIAGLEEARKAAQDLSLVKYDNYLQRIIEKLNEGRERAFSTKNKATQE